MLTFKYRRILLLTIICTFLLACSATKNSDGGRYIGKTPPLIRFTLIDGSPLLLESLRGKPSIIIFWATWCGFSRPVIEELARLASLPNVKKKVNFLAVSLDSHDAFEKVMERIKSSGINSLDHAFSGNEGEDQAYITLEGGGLPHIFVFDSNGALIATGHDISTVLSAVPYLKGL